MMHLIKKKVGFTKFPLFCFTKQVSTILICSVSCKWCVAINLKKFPPRVV